MKMKMYNELMKLPREMLFGMCRSAGVKAPRGYAWGPPGRSFRDGIAWRRASQDDAARALVPWLESRDFMRGLEVSNARVFLDGLEEG